MLKSQKKSSNLFFQMWHTGGVKLPTSVSALKGEEVEARPPYHTHWQSYDPQRYLPLGAGPFSSACTDCPSLCPSRAASSGAGLPGIGILSDTARKNGWQLAEHAGEARPDGMQRLLSRAVWDTDGVRDDVRSYVLEQLGQESAVLVIDESGFPKRGNKSAGVALQYCGTSGQVENCQVGVFLAYVTPRGHSLIDRELYLPLDWCQDRERCRAAHIPESVRFQTKPELAIQMLKRIEEVGCPIAWVVADTVYGGNLDLRTWLEAHASHYVLAVACNEPVGVLTPDGQRRRVEVSEVPALLLQEQDWQRLSMSEGTKGPRL